MPPDTHTELIVPKDLADRIRSVAREGRVDPNALLAATLEERFPPSPEVAAEGDPRTVEELVDWMLSTRHRRKLPPGMTIKDLISEGRA